MATAPINKEPGKIADPSGRLKQCFKCGALPTGWKGFCLCSSSTSMTNLFVVLCKVVLKTHWPSADTRLHLHFVNFKYASSKHRSFCDELRISARTLNWTKTGANADQNSIFLRWEQLNSSIGLQSEKGNHNLPNDILPILPSQLKSKSSTS